MENNIYKKLHLIQSKVKGLSKDKKSYSFSYVTGNKLLSFIKPLMDEQGLILKQEILSIDNERMDYLTSKGAKSEILSKVMMRFTWIDCETGETDINLFGANGQNDWEKGLGSALTYAERYFLLKYFHISTDEDDIDNPDRKKQENISISKDLKIDFWLNERVFNKVKELSKEDIKNCLNKYDNKTPFSKDGKYYGMKKEYRQELEKLAE